MGNYYEYVYDIYGKEIDRDYSYEAILRNITFCIYGFTYGAIPLLLILIKCCFKKQIPKVELFLAWSSLATWIFIIYFIILAVLSKKYYMYYYLGERFFIVEYAIYSGIAGGFCILAHLLDLCAQCLTRTGECSFSYRPLPNGCSKERMEKIMEAIRSTGPTLVIGNFVITDEKRVRVGKHMHQTVYQYNLESWDQFKYQTWKNQSLTGLDTLERLLQKDQTFRVDIATDIQPENENTENDYKQWKKEQMEPHGQEVEGAKGIGFKLGKKQQSNSKLLRMEEIITGEELASDYKPSKHKLEINLPYFAKSDPLESGKFVESYLVNKPCWLEGCTYVLSYVLLISPILRLIYWTCSKSAEIEVVKVFKTQGGIEESSFTRPPSPWRIPLNSEDKPFKDNLQSFDIRQGWSYAHMKS